MPVGIGFDGFEFGLDEVAPYLINITPLPDTTGNKMTAFSFTIVDDDTGINSDTIWVSITRSTLATVVAYEATGGFHVDWEGVTSDITSTLVGSNLQYTLIFEPTDGFIQGETLTIQVQVEDLVGNLLDYTYEISISETEFLRRTNVYINIQDRQETILYRTLVPDYGVNSSFVVGQRVATDNTLEIIDRSNLLPGNRVEDLRIHILDSIGFSVASEYFLATDVFVEDTTETEIPLFYKHILNETNLPRTNSILYPIHTDYALIDVQILDTTFKPLNQVLIAVDYTNGIVYSNFENEYSSPQSYKMHYIQYTVRNNATGYIFVYTELLNQQPVYRLGDLDDLDANYNLITDGRKVYLLDPQTTGFAVRLPVGTHVAFKNIEASRLFVKEPPKRITSDPWYVRVSNGSFFHYTNSLIYKYRVAEFYNQPFTPYAPVRRSVKEQSVVIGKKLIKTDYENILIDSDEGFHVNLEINDADSNAIAAFTTDDNMVGETADNGELYVKWSAETQVGIKSIDFANGIIEVDGVNLRLDHESSSSYYYTETMYEYTFVDLNPLTNRDMLGNTIAIFVEPELLGSESYQTLYYLRLDATGLVIDSNWPVFATITDPLYYRALPRHIDPMSAYELFTDYTIEGSGALLVLGEVSIVAPIGLHELVTLDTRIDGGGLKETRTEEAMALEPEVRWYHNIGTWNGIPYPGTASYMVEIPGNIIAGAGGVLSPNEIRELVDKHTGAGIYPVVREYTPEVTLTDILPGDDSIYLEWTCAGKDLYVKDALDASELAYNVYYKSIFDSHWTLANGTPIVEGGTNTYTVTGLSSSVTYFIVIIPGKKDGSLMTEYIRQPLIATNDTSLLLNALEDIKYPISSYRVQLPLR